jgi:hypothetical protein
MANGFRQARMLSGEVVEVPEERAEAFRSKPGFVAFADEDPSQGADDSGQWAEVDAAGGVVNMPPNKAARYRPPEDPVSDAALDALGAVDGVSDPAVARYAHKAIDGTFPFFESDGVMHQEGRFPEGSAQRDLEAKGYTFLDRDAFLRTRRSLDPIARAEDRDADTLAQAWDASMPQRPQPPVPSSPPRVAPQSIQPVAAPRPFSPTPRRAAPTPKPPTQDSPEDLDALQSAMEDLRNRSNAVDVERVPSSVPLASRLGGEPLPRPSRPAPAPDSQRPASPQADPNSELAAAQERGNLMRGIAGLARGSSRIGAAIAGVKPERGAADDMAEAADNPVREYLQRRQMAQQEQESAKQAALGDPSSPESKRFQSMVSRAFGSVYTPEQIQQMTASDAPLIGKYGEMVRTLEDRAAARATEEGLARDRMAASASEAEKQRAFQAEQGRLNRGVDYAQIAAQRDQRGDAKDSRVEAAELKLKQKIAERNVGGFEMEDPANPPSADGAKTMATVAMARDKILASLRRMEEDFSEAGTEWGGPAASRMEAEWKNVTDQMRMIADMGVPNGRDYEMLAKQIPNPVGPNAMMTRNSTIGAKFPILRQQVADMVNSTAKAYKFRPVGGGQQASTASAVRMKSPDGQTYTVDASEAEEAKQNGWMVL